MSKIQFKILLTSLEFNDKDCRKKKKEGYSVKKAGNLYSGPISVQVLRSHWKQRLILSILIYLDKYYYDLKIPLQISIILSESKINHNNIHYKKLY